MKRSLARLTALLPPALFLTTCTGCFSFSSFQSARIAEPGQAQGTIAVTRSDFREEDQDEAGWSLLEVRRRSCLKRDRYEGHLKISALVPDDGGFGAALGGGVKASLLRDRLALDLPVSWLMGDFAFRLVQLHPGLVGTLPLRPSLDLNADGSIYLVAASGAEPIYAWHVGLAAGPGDRRWALRPEIGWLRYSDEGRGESFVQFGLAVEFREPAQPRTTP